MGAQGWVANAKEDTVALFTNSTFTTDLSQHGLALTAASTGGYRTNDSLRAITGENGRELVVRLTLDGTLTNRTILAHASPANSSQSTYRIVTNASGSVEFRQGTTLLHTRAIGNGDAAIGWFTRPNPDTTGVSDALLSTFVVYHATFGWLETAHVAHAIPSTSSSWTLHVGGFWNGTFGSLSGQVSTVRISTAPDHSAVEMGEDFVAQRSAPIADPSPVGVLLPLTAASGIGSDGEWAGSPNMGWAAAHARRIARRTWAPLVSECYVDPEGMTASPDPTQWFQLAPGSSVWRMRLDTLRWVPVPPGCTHAGVRMHVKNWATAGDAVPMQFRVYAMNRPATLAKAKHPKAPTFEYSVLESLLVENDHGASGIGEWVLWADGDGGSPVGLLRLPVWTPDVPGFAGTVHLAVAVAFDPNGDAGNDANARCAIRSWHARPTVKYVGAGLL